MNQTGQRLRNESGAVLIAGLILTLALLMIIGTAVDIGNAFIIRRHLVALADQAALTGSQAIDLPALHQGTLALDPQTAQANALQSLAGAPAINVTASATQTTVAVHIDQTVSTIFLRLVGLARLHVAATATAAPRLP
jgi:uncharacterized membrane protein